MNRRDFVKTSALGAAALRTVPTFATADAPVPTFKVTSFEYEEATLAKLQADLGSGRATAVSLTQAYLRRIREIDQQGPTLRAVIELNPDAIAAAQDLDRERKEQGVRGPLHGLPILIKDNIATHDRMSTTAGSLALRGSVPPRDSFVAQRLREAGAVILGKTNLSEWANFRSNHSTSGWSGRGRLTRNPYILDRNPSGSSSGSGVAVAANLCAAAVGTETDGSILSPSSVNGIAGLKPTVGLISRSGIVPISHTQDTAGPMARTVTDVALLLGAVTGVDSRDPATATSARKSHPDYTRFLDPDGLRGARIGVVRKLFDVHPAAVKLVEGVLEEMRRLGAILVDPVELSSMSGLGNAEFEVLLYEFKAGINAYLEDLGPTAPVHTLEDIIEFNLSHREEEMPHFQQETLLRAQAKGPLTDAAYKDALEKCRRLSRAEGIDAVMEKHQLDALFAPTTGPAHITDLIYGDRDIGGSTTPAAVAGYPSVTVPAGFVRGLPVGVSFFGRAYSEPQLLKIAFAFEQATRIRKAPGFQTTIPA